MIWCISNFFFEYSSLIIWSALSMIIWTESNGDDCSNAKLWPAHKLTAFNLTRPEYIINFKCLKRRWKWFLIEKPFHLMWNMREFKLVQKLLKCFGEENCSQIFKSLQLITLDELRVSLLICIIPLSKTLFMLGKKCLVCNVYDVIFEFV